jgi:hypothetical protein
MLALRPQLVRRELAGDALDRSLVLDLVVGQGDLIGNRLVDVRVNSGE